MKPDIITDFVAETEKELRERPLTLFGYIHLIVATLIFCGIIQGVVGVIFYMFKYVIDNAK